jgi:chromosome segregation ATPase
MGAVTTNQETSKTTNLALDIHFIDTNGAEVAIVMPEGIPSIDAASHVKLNTLTLQVREYDASINTYLVKTCLAVHDIRELLGRNHWMPYVKANLPLNSLRSIERKAEFGGLIKKQIATGKFTENQFSNFSQRAMELLFQQSDEMIEKVIPALDNKTTVNNTKDVEAAIQKAVSGLQKELDKVKEEKARLAQLSSEQTRTMDTMSTKIDTLDRDLDRVLSENKTLKDKTGTTVELVEAPPSIKEQDRKKSAALEAKIKELDAQAATFEKKIKDSRAKLDKTNLDLAKAENKLTQVDAAKNELGLLTQAVGYIQANYNEEKLIAMLKAAPSIAPNFKTVIRSVRVFADWMDNAHKVAIKS